MLRILSLFLAAAFLATAPAALAQDSAPEFVWVVTASSATRFIESDSSEVEKTEAGAKLQVIYRDGTRLRLRFPGSKFGWVDAATVSNVEPTPPAAPPAP